jgi:hypothetical protein
MIQMRARLGKLVVISFILIVTCLQIDNIVHRASLASLDSDEATTILASLGILKTGLPTLPSGQIYWRALTSHYGDALSIFLFGDNEIGWRALSILSISLLLAVPAALFLRRNMLFSAVLWVVLIGYSHLIDAIAVSARMYGLYVTLNTMCYLATVYGRYIKWNLKGVLYIALFVVTGMTHAHFVIFIPGLLLINFWDAWRSETRFARLKTPSFGAPLAGLITALFLHLREHHFPRAFSNPSSLSPALAEHMDVIYPFTTLKNGTHTVFLGLCACVAVVAIIGRYRKQEKGKRDEALTTAIQLLVINCMAYGAVSIALPFKKVCYVTPLYPIMVLLLCVSVNLFTKTWNRRAVWILVPIAAFLYFPIIQQEVSTCWKPLKHDRWRDIKKWVDVNQAIIISPEPEIAFLRLGRIDHEVRTLGVNAEKRCGEVKDDQFGNSYIYSRCTLSKVLSAASGPVVYSGGRSRFNGTIKRSLSDEIKKVFLFVGEFDGQDLFCYPRNRSCNNLYKLNTISLTAHQKVNE